MIEGKVIKFGFGTIVISGDDFTKVLTLSYIEPPKEVGGLIRESILPIEEVKFKYNKDMEKFYEDLKMVDEENCKIEFRGFTFDFTEYNTKSVNALMVRVKKVIVGFQLGLAC